MKSSKNTDFTLSKTRLEEQASVGLGGTRLSRQHANHTAYINADAVPPSLEPRTSSSTIERPWSPYQDSKAGIPSQYDSFVGKTGLQSSAETATESKPSEKTKSEGIKNDQEKPRMDLISSKALIELSRVLTFGARKYESHNWRAGISYSRIIAAIYRHLAAYNDGETHDQETGLSHMAHVLCEAMFLVEFESTRPEMDDRYKGDK